MPNQDRHEYSPGWSDWSDPIHKAITQTHQNSIFFTNSNVICTSKYRHHMKLMCLYLSLLLFIFKSAQKNQRHKNIRISIFWCQKISRTHNCYRWRRLFGLGRFLFLTGSHCKHLMQKKNRVKYYKRTLINSFQNITNAWFQQL